MHLARPLTALVGLLCWPPLASCARPATAPAVKLEVPGGEVRIGALLLQTTVRMAPDSAARGDSAGVLYVDVRARNVGDETATSPRRLAPTLHVRLQSCVIEVRLAAPTAPSRVLWRHGDLAYPCPSQSSRSTLASGGDWVSLSWREERVPLGAVQRARLPGGRYLLSASLVAGLFTGETGELDAPPPGPERARWSPDPGLRCASRCIVTVPAGVLRVGR